MYGSVWKCCRDNSRELAQIGDNNRAEQHYFVLRILYCAKCYRYHGSYIRIRLARVGCTREFDLIKAFDYIDRSFKLKFKQIFQIDVPDTGFDKMLIISIRPTNYFFYLMISDYISTSIFISISINLINLSLFSLVSPK